MAAQTGRALEIHWGGQTSPPGVRLPAREKSLTFVADPIDITGDDDNGWRSLLSDPAERQVNLSISGVRKIENLLADWFADARSKTVDIVYADGDVISGTFLLVNYTETGNYQDAVLYDAELQSSGVVTITQGT